MGDHVSSTNYQSSIGLPSYTLGYFCIRTLVYHLKYTANIVGIQRKDVDEEKLINLIQEHECFYNLKHNHDNLLKDNVWKGYCKKKSCSFRIRNVPHAAITSFVISSIITNSKQNNTVVASSSSICVNDDSRTQSQYGCHRAGYVRIHL